MNIISPENIVAAALDSLGKGKISEGTSMTFSTFDFYSDTRL